ncbi:MAG: winged helix-turn-helix domain-containing protein [Deltaproteobacteria bacterium]|nr:winged helix-turn-helix domain-containing protein [Deltaproteobacteria bacterium]
MTSTSGSKTKSTSSESTSSIEDIGNAAGELWRYLDAHGAGAVDAIKRKAKLPSDVFYAAIGWLAREGKVEVRVDGKKVQLTLK